MVERGLSLERRVLVGVVGAGVVVAEAAEAALREPGAAAAAPGAATPGAAVLGATALAAAEEGTLAAAEELSVSGEAAVAELAALGEELSTTGVEAVRTRTTGVAAVLSGSLVGCTEAGKSCLGAGFFLGFFTVFFADFFAGSLVLRIKPVNTKAAIRDRPRAKIACRVSMKAQAASGKTTAAVHIYITSTTRRCVKPAESRRWWMCIRSGWKGLLPALTRRTTASIMSVSGSSIMAKGSSTGKKAGSARP